MTAAPSPRPWRVDDTDDRTTLIDIVDSDDTYVATNLLPADASLIVAAVNYYKPELHCDWRELTPEDAVAHCREVAARLGDTPCARDHLQLAAWIEERDRLRDELESTKGQAESEKRWADEYFEEARKAAAERDRLRDIMGRIKTEMERCHRRDGEISQELIDAIYEATEATHDA